MSPKTRGAAPGAAGPKAGLAGSPLVPATPVQAWSEARPGDLTVQQIMASGTSTGNVFINAGPGTGKTTVAAQRFGALRFSAESRTDDRAVVAVSFTRAATWNLHRRVRRVWGPAALAWPHRIVTLDAIMCDLFHDLLGCGLLVWPNGHTALRVEDSWNVLGGSFWTRQEYQVRITSGGVIEVVTGYSKKASQRAPSAEIRRQLLAGTCTHEDLRDLLESALSNRDVADRVRNRLATTMRALIVDEVFDANDLDIAVIELAVQAAVAVTLVGDPWQALYVFRGARPEVVPELLIRTSMRTLPLTESFRWRTPGQKSLAHALRAGESVNLDRATGGVASVHADVVLASTWNQLWEVDNHVLPLAFHAFKGGLEEAAATVLLNHVTRSVFSEDATYLGDSLTALAIDEADVPRQLEPDLQRVVEILLTPGEGAVKAAYEDLVRVIKLVSPRELRRAHHAHTKRLTSIAARLSPDDRPVPGLTIHQAKGREWDVVCVTPSESERDRLQQGLLVTEDTDRKLYVACTRARYLTVQV